MNRLSLSDKIYYSRGIPLCQQNLRKNLRNFQTLKIIIKTGENRHFSALCLRLLGDMKNCRPSGNSVGRQKFFYFFAKMLRKHLMHSAKSRPSLRMERALRSGRWDSIYCGKQPLNILEVVGLWAPTAVETCHWHVSKSRPSLRTKRALRSGRWDSICCGKQPLNILKVVGLRAPTAVAECHWHSAKSRPSLRMKRALRSGRWDSFSAEKPRRLKHATGMFLRAAFRIPPSE